MPRKVGAGGFRPRNTLQTGNTISPKAKQHTYARTSNPNIYQSLATATSVGDNVPGQAKAHHTGEPPAKRQKVVDDGVSVVIPTSGSPWFDRQAASSPPRPSLRERQYSNSSATTSSMISNSQQPRADRPHDSNDPFHNVLRMTKPFQRKGRKPKSTSAASSQMDCSEIIEIHDSQGPEGIAPPPTGRSKPSPNAEGDARDEDDGLVFVSEQRAQQKTPTQLGMSSDRAAHEQSPMIRVPSVASTLGLNARQQHSATSPARKTRQPRTICVNSPPRSPPLRHQFRRDSTTHASPSVNLRRRMLASSETRPAEGSEDELANGDVISSGNPRSAKLKTVRSRSPGDIKHTNFVTPKKSACNDYIGLKSLHMQCGSYTGPGLMLVLAPDQKSFYIQQHDDPIVDPVKGEPYLLTSKHAQRVLAGSDPECLKMALRGARDEVTGGNVWLTFHHGEDLEKCIEAVLAMTDGKVHAKMMDE